ncbi:SusD/RagB family nutrient-binding outer membrane lipoprotein [Hymenobacter lucidus]|uniref:SusD/RagB family nutrient-binding outer membrane lipoprotein n=1 Tax=Hymenobacter lucidus TaxID=2880930 RepID=A0ABS8ATM9_9BACT|nr:SusD/RagB family nutrient-binding outer membrane lipoprotein [Hymenobacter lucidus]MCB2409590.1 SusD/RagB family nutrient-binding outer membrane lipoprotein [Hymenobacter lucidus]
MSTTACEKDIFDINTDPNNPSTADIVQVLPSGQAFVSFVVGGQFNIMGQILAQHMGIPSGANQYRSYDQYNIPSSTFDGRQFQNLYAGALQDFQNVIEQGTPASEFRMVGIAKILKAHTFQVLTDAYGDLPYSEALTGINTTPKYDKQQDIYKNLQLLLDDAINDINKQQGRFPATSDLNYQAGNEANMGKWIRLANTLKLRLYMRTSEVDPAGAAAGIKELYARNADATALFMRSGESFQFNNGTVANSENPFYQANFRLQNNLAGSTTVGTIMTSTNDPRLPVYFLDADLKTPELNLIFVEPGRNVYANNFITPTTPVATAPNSIRYSFPGTFFIGQAFSNSGAAGSTYAGIAATDAAAKSRPTLLLTYEESLFLRSEAAARGWSTAAENAKTLYDNGVTASMTRYGVTAANTATYLAQTRVAFPVAGSVQDKVKAISTQKWLSYYATNGMEAWSEQRRTNNPTLTSPIVNILGAGKFVNRLPYVDSELTRNTANVSAVGLVPGDVQTKVWWDAN